jgi:hypothetical protein
MKKIDNITIGLEQNLDAKQILKILCKIRTIKGVFSISYYVNKFNTITEKNSAKGDKNGRNK